MNVRTHLLSRLLGGIAAALLAGAPALSAPGSSPEPAGEEKAPQTRPHHHPSDATDDATSRHSFEDTERWVARFDDPSREEWQKPGQVVRALRLRPGMTVADIGAGTGYFNRMLSEAVGPQGRVLAVDLEPAMVTYMKERAQREKTPNVTAILAEPSDPKLPPGEVDLILIVDTYHHFDDRLGYFERLKGVLKPGGRVAIIDFHKRELPVGPEPEHKLERGQVVAEMEAAGWSLDREPEFLPYQYFLIFQRR